MIPALVEQGAENSPSTLLAAQYHVVEFTGRRAEVNALLAWRDEPVLGRTVRLLHGPGGQGKTRLAARIAAMSARDGWQVIQVRHSSTLPGPGISNYGADRESESTGVLVVIDYAERWPTTHLMRVLADKAVPSADRTRVLMVARPAGTWWQGLRHELTNNRTRSTDMRLQPLATDELSRKVLFMQAVRQFALALQVDASNIKAPAMTGEPWNLVLTIHMAALAAVELARRATDLPKAPSVEVPTDPVAISAFLLDREYAHWEALFSNNRMSTPPTTFSRVVYAATICRPTGHREAVKIVQKEILNGGPGAVSIVDDHLKCYPSPNPQAVFEPMYPDRLGEDFLALQTPGHDVSDYESDPWANGATGRLLNILAGIRPSNVAPAVNAIIETAQQWSHFAQSELYPFLRENPHFAIAAGAGALNALAAMEDIDLGVLEAIEPLLPSRRHADLDSAAAAIVGRLTRHRLDNVGNIAEQAALHATLGWRLANAGRRIEALDSTRAAIAIYHELVDVDRDKYAVPLARALMELSRLFAALNRDVEALDAAEEAAEIRRYLCARHPGTFDGQLARALNNLSLRKLELDRGWEAFAATTESVRLLRQLIGTNESDAEASLASALNTRSMVLAHLGEHEEALESALESVRMLENLSGNDPNIYDVDLARAANNLGLWFADVRRFSEAISRAEQSVQIYRQLSQTNEAYERDLASALSNLSLRQRDLGQRSVAIATAADAVRILRRLARMSPDLIAEQLERAEANLHQTLSGDVEPIHRWPMGGWAN